jgi:Entner-Doudoroff aldolase
MNGQRVIARIESGRVIAILRGDFRASVTRIAEALALAGVTAVEATLNSPGVIELIATLVKQFGDRMAVGAGTVLKTQDVGRVADAGGQFIVSPNCNAAVIAHTKVLNLVSIPGCFTPTEVIAAIDAGADAIKLFPAGSLGPGYVKALRGPLGDVRLVPTGGVTPELARDYQRAGAWAVGVGSELIGPDVEAIEPRARAFVEAMRGPA